jgi:hypothetical protein
MLGFVVSSQRSVASLGSNDFLAGGSNVDEAIAEGSTDPHHLRRPTLYSDLPHCSYYEQDMGNGFYVSNNNDTSYPDLDTSSEKEA